MNETQLMFKMRQQMVAMQADLERMARKNLALRVACDDAVSAACGFAWDVGAGNETTLTDEQLRECLAVRFAPEEPKK